MEAAQAEGGPTPSFSGTLNGSSPPDGAAVTSKATPAQDTAGTPTQTKAESPPAVEKPSEPKGVGKRIDELTRNWREAQRQNERLLALLEQQRTQSQPHESPKAEQPKSLKDFNYNEQAYQDHLYSEARKHAEKAAKEAGERWRQEQEAVQRRAKFDERVAQFAKSVEDYHDVVNDRTPVSEGMADFLLDSDEAGALMYYLGNNPDEAAKLYRLSPAKAGRELQKIEDRLVSERKKAAEKPVSQAPPPPPKIEGSDPGNVENDPSKMTDAQFRKWREKQIATRGR
jgi:hypothetical protein